MEIEKKDRDKTFKIFCEKHRPLKIVKEMIEQEKTAIDEVQRFSKVIDKCMDISLRAQQRTAGESQPGQRKRDKMSPN